MPARTEMLRDRAISREEFLSVARGLEPLHAPLPLTSGLMGIFCAVIEIAMLAMFHTWEDLSLSSTIALQFVGDAHLDRQNHLIHMTFVAGPRTAATELIGILLAKLPTPFPNRFITHAHAAFT